MILAIILFSAIGLEYAILFGFSSDILTSSHTLDHGSAELCGNLCLSKDIRLGIRPIICIALQIVESNIITPYVQGKQHKLNHYTLLLP